MVYAAKLAFAAATLSLISTLLPSKGFAFARGGGAVASCSDPRLMKRFSTAGEAHAYCPQFASEFYDVGVTYDYGFGQYTCSCYWKGSQGGR